MTPNAMPKILPRFTPHFAVLLCLLLSFVFLVAGTLNQASARYSKTGSTRNHSNVQRVTQQFTAKCIGVSDGDTITVLRDGAPVKIRLSGIDCPEKSQDFGSRAKQFTSDMVFGKDVVVEEHGHDRYGRLIAEVFTSSGESLNKALLQNGFAWWYRQYSKEQELGALEGQAQIKKLGLWAGTGPQPPWLFRRSGKGRK